LPYDSTPYRSDARAADATGIPRLSAAAEAATSALRNAPDEKDRAKAWRAVQKDERIGVELGVFRAAVTQRFGEDGVRQMLRAEGRAGAVTSPSVGPEQRPVLDQVAHLTVTLRSAERAGVAATQREAESERQGQRRGLRM